MYLKKEKADDLNKRVIIINTTTSNHNDSKQFNYTLSPKNNLVQYKKQRNRPQNTKIFEYFLITNLRMTKLKMIKQNLIFVAKLQQYILK